MNLVYLHNMSERSPCFTYIHWSSLRGEDMTVFGDGSQTRSFCYVHDLVEGIYRLLLSDYSSQYW